FGCTATDSTYVNIINAHIAQNDTTICAGESIELSVTGGGSANITDGLVAWYPFNGNAEDKSGYENHGTVVGASLVTDRFGFPNSAYDFNGIDNHITFNSPVATGSVPISFTFWAQSSYSGGHDIMGQFTGSDSSKDVRIQFSTPQIAFKGLSFKNPVHFATAPSEKVHDSNWHHYAMVMGENNNYRYNNIKFYVDGELIPIGYGHNWGNWTYSLLDENFNIGKQGGGCGGYYNGVLDDIKIFNKAINPEEIQLLYQEGTGNYSYLWSTGDTTASITVTPTQTTTYYVEITDGINWCTDSVTVTVENAVTLDLKVNLEGPWFSGEMTPFLNVFGFIPLSQPYSGQPWNYAGTESVTAIPNPDVIDWVLVELRETTGNPSTASSDSLVGIKAGFLLKDGSVTAPDGVSDLVFSHDVQANLYAVVWHRNHLGIMSNYPLVENSSIYSYDFTISGNQVYGGSLAHKEVSPGIWAMVAADGNADRQVNNNDKNEVWASQAGLSGYYPGDFDMNSQVDNSDKNDLWVPNSGRGAQVPDFAKAMSGEPDGILKEGYKCMVPE
ncbi:MAG: hypothetical protein JXA03_07670, partial [Bacteroidales bacterium]|nr:hypothetical protein [Bacteroidales bacterium]